MINGTVLMMKGAGGCGALACPRPLPPKNTLPDRDSCTLLDSLSVLELGTANTVCICFFILMS